MSNSPDTTLVYSGKRRPGFTENGSYDRLIFDNEHECLEQTDDVMDVALACIRRFRRSERSRLVARLRTSCSIDIHEIRDLLTNEMDCETTVLPDIDGINLHVTIGANNVERAVDRSSIYIMQRHIREKISGLSIESFDDHALAVLEKNKSQEMIFDEKPNADDIFSLWQHSFGWTYEQCQNYAESRDESDRLFVLRNAERRAISGVLVADGESTEWSTLPEYQKKGFIVPLLIFANCVLLRDKVSSIFAELRWNRSIGPAIQSGFSIDTDGDGYWLLTNHVTIGDSPKMDPPDPWNVDKPMFGEDINGKQLRSFTVAHLDPSKFTDKIMDAYLERE
jgi:hypothetical protein